MWIAGEIPDIPVLVGVVYIGVTQRLDDANCQILQSIENDAAHRGTGRKVLPMGDYNGHIQLLDVHQDANGCLMLQLAKDLFLEVANLRGDCDGVFTWCAMNHQLHPAIDYILMSRKLSVHTSRLHVDEAGEHSLGIDLLQRLYNNMVIATFGQTSTEPVLVRRGLKQRCPLSPPLYMLYTTGLERALVESGLGFALWFQYAKSPQVWTLQGLVFTHDLVLLAENTDQLQNLTDISTHHVASLKLTFHAKKSTLLRFSGPADERELVLPNGQPIPRSTEYRYLGVTFCDGECYDVHEARMRQSSQRAIGTLRKCCLWGFHRYVIVRELWNAVHAPCPTFANAVLCLSMSTRE